MQEVLEKSLPKKVPPLLISAQFQNFIFLQIANALDNVCQIMPAFFVDECHFMICTYYDELINALLGYFGDPLEACTQLTLCP